MRKMKYTGLLFCMLTFVGCGEFLDPKSSDEYVPENAESLDEMLVGEAYPSVDASENLFLLLNILDDDVTVTKEKVGFQEQGKAEVCFAVYTLQPDLFGKMDGTSYQNTLVWDAYYGKILGANAALDYVDEVSGSREMKDFVKAQALGLRAFYYFNLVNLFGAPYTSDKEAPGVPLKLSAELSTVFSERNSVKAVYEQVLNDLSAAASLFMTLPADRQFNKGYRINLPTVQMLKSRAFLFMGEWENAIRLADSVLMYPQFTLYDLTLFQASNDKPKPHYSNYDNGESMWHYGSISDLCYFAVQIGYPVSGVVQNRKLFNASDELLATYADEEDLRGELYVFDEYYNTTKLNNRVAMGKVFNIANQISQSESGFGMSVRLAEAYLILAEAHAMLGNTDKALFYLNQLRAKRMTHYSPVSGLTGDDLIRFAREERRRELCFEGFRWFDLRRWGMESFTKKWKVYDETPRDFVIRKNDPAFTLPIPQKVIDRNPGLEQNPLAEPRVGI